MIGPVDHAKQLSCVFCICCPTTLTTDYNTVKIADFSIVLTPELKHTDRKPTFTMHLHNCYTKYEANDSLDGKVAIKYVLPQSD